jgi:hypothetical protein
MTRHEHGGKKKSIMGVQQCTRRVLFLDNFAQWWRKGLSRKSTVAKNRKFWNFAQGSFGNFPLTTAIILDQRLFKPVFGWELGSAKKCVPMKY